MLQCFCLFYHMSVVAYVKVKERIDRISGLSSSVTSSFSKQLFTTPWGCMHEILGQGILLIIPKFFQRKNETPLQFLETLCDMRFFEVEKTLNIVYSCFIFNSFWFF